MATITDQDQYKKKLTPVEEQLQQTQNLVSGEPQENPNPAYEPLVSDAPAVEEKPLSPLDLINNWVGDQKDELEEDAEDRKEREFRKQRLHLAGDTFRNLSDMVGGFSGAPSREWNNPYLNKSLVNPDLIDKEYRDKNLRLSNYGLQQGRQALENQMQLEERQRQFDAKIEEAEKRSTEANNLRDRELNIREDAAKTNKEQIALENDPNHWRNKLDRTLQESRISESKAREGYTNSQIAKNEKYMEKIDADIAAAVKKAEESLSKTKLPNSWRVQGYDQEFELDNSTLELIFQDAWGKTDKADYILRSYGELNDQQMKTTIVQEYLNELFENSDNPQVFFRSLQMAAEQAEELESSEQDSSNPFDILNPNKNK